MWMRGPWDCFPMFWIFPLLFFVVILFFMFRGGRSPFCGSNDHGKPDNAREILNQRYAKGEISKDQFEQMKKDIQN
jgi:putative membrane protein